MNFDGIAPWYRTLEYLGMGRALERRREEFLSDLAPSSGIGRVLLLGDGDGRFLAALRTTNPAVEVDTVDGSAAMLRLACRRVASRFVPGSNVGRITFHHADALLWQPPDGCVYDAVVTHFFLDCLTEPQIDALLVRLRPFLAPRGVWIVSEFNQPSNGPLFWRARLWINGLYRLFGWTTGLPVRRLPDHGPGLKAHGFRLEKEVVANGGLLVSQRWRRSAAGASEKSKNMLPARS